MPKQTLPPQHQDRQPGIEAEMTPRPEFMPRYPGSGRLKDRVALITGGDSGIGRAVAVAMAREGAHVALAYKDEHEDAQETVRLVEEEGQRAVAIAGDLGEPAFCREIVEKTIAAFGRLDVLVNNAAEQHEAEDIADITDEQMERTFQTNILAMLRVTREARPHLKPGAAIVNTASITAYKGNPKLMDYATTKGAIVSFTRSLSMSLASKGIRVNAVAPGPIWTPLIPASFKDEKVAQFGADVPMGRPGQPNEVAPCYVFLACDDSSYMSGQVLHPNGGTVVNS